MTIKELEDKWLKNFKASILVENVNFKPKEAKFLFYGNRLASDPYLRKGFRSFHENYNFQRPHTELEAFIAYLKIAGISLNKQAILNASKLEDFSWKVLLKKGFFLLKSLADQEVTMDIQNPFVENQGDLFFFLNLELAFINKQNKNTSTSLSLGMRILRVLGIAG